jgi:death on curing protein
VTVSIYSTRPTRTSRTPRPWTQPATVAFGVEAYEDVWSKAAALLQSLAGNHALLDGNKRLAWVAARVFLDLNDVPPVPVDVDNAEAFVIAVVTHELGEVEAIAGSLAALYKDGTDRAVHDQGG